MTAADSAELAREALRFAELAAEHRVLSAAGRAHGQVDQREHEIQQQARDLLADMQERGILRAADIHLADGLRDVATVWAPGGRTMALRSSAPGVQLYTGNKLKGVAGRGGVTYEAQHGLCLETASSFPDAPNRPHFPSVVLRPGERYEHVTVHEFGAS